MKKDLTQINVKKKTKEELKALLLELSVQKGKIQSMNVVVEELLKYYKDTKSY